MALHSAAKGKLLAVMGDEVLVVDFIVFVLYIFKILSSGSQFKLCCYPKSILYKQYFTFL